MEGKDITLPTEKREYGYEGYELAVHLARNQLASSGNIEQICLKSGARYIESRNAISLEYLDRLYLISLPDIEISFSDSEEEVPLYDKILILHYLNGARGTPNSNKLITFKELRDGAVYFPTFYKRSIKILLDSFSEEPDRLVDVAGVLGGCKADFGDAAVTIYAFHHVPVTLVLWKGDEELAPEGNIMFDSTISDYLPTEDIAVLCQTIVLRLVRLLKTGGDSSGKR